MKKPSWLVKLLEELKSTGKVPADHTGKVTLVLNVSQGGLQDADLSVNEKIK